VIGEYIHWAQSGTTDSRAEFQREIADSGKHIYEGMLVYQLDRFAGNCYDSAINKAKRKKNGVQGIPASENIGDKASGILVESVLKSNGRILTQRSRLRRYGGAWTSTRDCFL